MDRDLPVFRYHPDPVATGIIVEQKHICLCCESERTHLYVGPTYSRDVVEDDLCPWCIADGSAASKFDATFADGHPLGALGPEIIATVTTRTPSFIGWQQEAWLAHCDDACAYIDRVGVAELAGLPDGVVAVRRALGEWGRSDQEQEELFDALHRDGNFVAHLFRCLHCGEWIAALDAS